MTMALLSVGAGEVVRVAPGLSRQRLDAVKAQWDAEMLRYWGFGDSPQNILVELPVDSFAVEALFDESGDEVRPAGGQFVLVGQRVFGQWTGYGNTIAQCRGGVWSFATPSPGWTAVVQTVGTEGPKTKRYAAGFGWKDLGLEERILLLESEVARLRQRLPP